MLQTYFIIIPSKLIASAAHSCRKGSTAAPAGDHLGFTAGFDAQMLRPVIGGKLVGGITAMAVALWMKKRWTIMNKEQGQVTGNPGAERIKSRNK